MLGFILCFFGRHHWVDDIGQTRDWRYQHCDRAGCVAERKKPRESFYLK